MRIEQRATEDANERALRNMRDMMAGAGVTFATAKPVGECECRFGMRYRLRTYGGQDQCGRCKRLMPRGTVTV